MSKYVGVLLGIATGALVFATATSASTGARNIHASFANIGIAVNGQNVSTTAEPMIYNYNVYVPISTVAHALGANVTWTNKPAAVNVTPGASLASLSVFYNGKELPSGVTDGQFYGIPVGNPEYTSATGLTVAVDSSNNVNYQDQTTPVISSGTPLISLTPAKLYGDFSNNTLYPQGQLSGYWPAEVLGTLYPGEYTIEWAVNPAQTAVIPGVDYALGGKYSQLSGQLAIDDLARNDLSSVQLVFVGDGKTLGETGWIQGGAEPTPISINVSGVNTLEIQYQFKDNTGKEYDMGQSFAAPGVNPDGSKTDSLTGVDFMDAVLTPTAN